MGPLQSILSRLPMMPQLPSQGLDDKDLDKMRHIMDSMTQKERLDPDLLNPSRLRRVAKGSGRPLKEVELLWDRFQKMRSMMRNFKGMFPGMGGPSPLSFQRKSPSSSPRSLDREKLRKARKMVKQRRKQGRS